MTVKQTSISQTGNGFSNPLQHGQESPCPFFLGLKDVKTPRLKGEIQDRVDFFES
jgi:hypothetical protein